LSQSRERPWTYRPSVEAIAKGKDAADGQGADGGVELRRPVAVFLYTFDLLHLLCALPNVLPAAKRGRPAIAAVVRSRCAPVLREEPDR
jgi:hypothetical protein